METLLIVLIGLVAGVSGGLFGIGGGIIIVPALVGLLGFTQHKAQGTSLVALLAPVGLLALSEYWKKGNADLRVGGIIAAAFLFGAFAGSRLALSFSDIMMKKIFAIFLILVGCYMFYRTL